MRGTKIFVREVVASVSKNHAYSCIYIGKINHVERCALEQDFVLAIYIELMKQKNLDELTQ